MQTDTIAVRQQPRSDDEAADDRTQVFVYAMRVYAEAMDGELDVELALDELDKADTRLLELGDRRLAEYVRDCACKLLDTKIQGGLDGVVVAARLDHHLRRMHCRVIITRGRRRARSSHRRVGARTAAKATSTGDPDEPPARNRRTATIGGAL